ncbi:MAG: ATP-binding protein [Betaproteobacteria bacterium]|nr:ATP-binding protein [Rubrivivax sp.]
MSGTPGFTLFWRTLLLVVMLLAAGVFAWVQTLRAMEFEPRVVQEAQQVARLVSLASAALSQADGGSRAALFKAMDQPPARLLPRRADERLEPYEVDSFSRRLGSELRAALGRDTELAGSIDGQPGPWVGFRVGPERFWLQATSDQPPPPATGPWPLWLGIALLVTLLGSVLTARLINRPLKQLSFAASRIREGDLESQLDENTRTIEIREVNRGFNRMARELARVEEDRAVMLAGISHDLRTPLARLRLETEMSVADEEARRNMALDIDQLDAIIDKFMDYARPGDTELQVVHVATLLERAMAGFRDTSQIRITSRVPRDLLVLADETELGRVFLNLFENARRYGRGTDTGIADVRVSAQTAGSWVILSVRDHGPGVAPEKLPQLTTPFFRGDAARTAATGAGLGLAIVDKAMQRMGGTLELANAPEGGLVAHLRLQGEGPPGVQGARRRQP